MIIKTTRVAAALRRSFISSQICQASRRQSHQFPSYHNQYESSPPHPPRPITIKDPSRQNASRSGTAAIVLLAAGGIVLWHQNQSHHSLRADASSNGTESFQGKPIVLAPGGEKRIAHDERTGEDIELIPTGTSHVPHFPKTIYLPKESTSSDALPVQATLSQNVNHPGEEEYTLLGLGIRTVSFLNIQVYVVGLYVATKNLQQLQQRLIKRVNPTASALVSGEKEDLRNALLDAEQSQAIWEELLRDTKHSKLDTDGIGMALRVVPTRGTDFNHLRDGWIRGITGRIQQSQKAGSDEYSDDAFGESKRDFEKLLSGKGKAVKGSIVILKRATHGGVGVLFQAKENDRNVQDFGSVADERVSRLLWLVYFGGKNVSSEGARKGVADGCVTLVERPVGTVETKVD